MWPNHIRSLFLVATAYGGDNTRKKAVLRLQCVCVCVCVCVVCVCVCVCVWCSGRAYQIYIYTQTCGSMLKLSVLSVLVLLCLAGCCCSWPGEVGLKLIRSGRVSGAPLSYPPCMHVEDTTHTHTHTHMDTCNSIPCTST